MLGVAVNDAIAGSGYTVTDCIDVTAAPARFVTVSVYTTVVGELATGAVTVGMAPLVTEPTPWSIAPVPSVNTGESVIVSPGETAAGSAVKLVTEGAATDWMETIEVAMAPAGLVTVSVYTVVAELGGVTTAGDALTTAPTPWSIEPAPFENVNASDEVAPSVTIEGVAVKLEIEGSGCTVTVCIEVAVEPARFVTVRV